MNQRSTFSSFPRLAYDGELLDGCNIAIMPTETLGLQEHLNLLGSPEPYFHSIHHIKKHLAQVEIHGRGGASFPLSRKIAAYESLGDKPIIVANGSESELLSKKDAALLTRFPHLVIDGLVILGSALGAKTGYVHIKSGNALVEQAVKQALLDRKGADPVSIELSIANSLGGYPAGVESAVISSIQGDGGKPIYLPMRPIVRGVKKRPTLVSNVETLAQLALLTRFGSNWFGEISEDGDAGTRLLTITDVLGMSCVVEVAVGTRISDLLYAINVEPHSANCALVGGYFGQVVDLKTLITARVSLKSIRNLGLSLGAGVIALSQNCPISETASILGYLASQSSGQCGPCYRGLPELAKLWSDLEHGKFHPRLIERVGEVGDQIIGRGGCAMPDGAVLLARSTLRLFGGEVEVHRSGDCSFGLMRSTFVPQTLDRVR